MPLLSEGQTIRDTYEVERFLGEGAFAEVYRVKHRFLGRQAMKVFKRAGMTAAEVEETLGEAILLSKIGHPNIVRVFDANVLETGEGLRGYFTMENVAGGTLDAFWRSFGRGLMPVSVAVDLARQICRGLAVAHGENPPIIHRDIKPQNILVGYEANGLRTRISDFGLARRVNPLTLLATAAGTLAFKPPEVFGDSKADSPAGDVYALGVTLYLMLSDVFPYEVGPDFATVAPSDFAHPPRPLMELNVDVDAALSDIVLQCLQRDPLQRYSDARALLSELEAWRPRPPLPLASELSAAKPLSPTTTSKSAFQDDGRARDMARQALRVAREEGRLADAADLMEEAFNLHPDLREKYASRVKLWRAGVSM